MVSLVARQPAQLPKPKEDERFPAAPAKVDTGSVVLDAEQTAAALIFLHETPFGGQPAGRRFRLAHASVREITGRPVLGQHFLDEVAMHLARAGFDLVRMDTYVVIQQAKQHQSLRRAPANLRAAARAAAASGNALLVPITADPTEGEKD
ncbi:hypothetical protein AAFN86_26990 [Roseomonas sp. CAU 1739]|uniref:hypothetical protein n=1 Tax=Roseomonas sp. CAU 1739 TaxID=3140364 RepID=UPI00325B6F0A